MNKFVATIKDYGADIEKLFLFENDAPELLSYATLLNAYHSEDSEVSAVKAVYEWQESPLIFLVDGDEIKDEEHFQKIRRMLALRGDAPYLGVVRVGQLTVYRIALDKEGRRESRLKLDTDNKAYKKSIFAILSNARPQATKAREVLIADIVLELLREAINQLIKEGICEEDAISFAGRALFVRFLGDRDLVPELLKEKQNDVDIVGRLFDTEKSIRKISKWLDETFNGDLLPLSTNAFMQLTKESCFTLGNIARRAKGGQLLLGWEKKWDYLDFAHIPVGVLSQAYEQYMKDHLSIRQQKEGSYYTPRPIVELMVKAAFHALGREGKASEAKVLDPAVGAGVFLISAFRQLVREKWIEIGKRPDTKELRNILYHQLTGFDINEGALRFASLGLYLISIELDPCPHPVEKLRFNYDLRNKVLHNVSDDKDSNGLGSLGYAVGQEHQNLYDLVIGNPPWKTATKLPNWSDTKNIVKKIASDRLNGDIPRTLLPNEGLDLPFVWRAMDWAKEKGQIAFALHARILFQQGKGMPVARNAIFSAIDVTGVLNGAELRTTKVWPGVTAPFCLLFARNQLPSSTSGFRFVSPHVEQALNNNGFIRVDASNADIVTTTQIHSCPELFKILYRGSSLDLEIFNRIKDNRFITLESYWKSLFGEFRKRPRQIGNGYKKSYRTDPPKSSEHLIGLPELQKNSHSLLVETKKLPKFNEKLLSRPRKRETFRGPLLITHKSPPSGLGRIRVMVSEEDTVFSSIYYGYSSFGHPDSKLLVQYLALFLSSRPVLWNILMTSGEFGFEREVVEKFIIDKTLILPLEHLNETSRKQIERLFNLVSENESEENWGKVDAWAAKIYGLNKRDLQVINDTLKYNLPFSRNRINAQASPSSQDVKDFCHFLNNELLPFSQKEKKFLDIYPLNISNNAPWEIIRVKCTLSTIKSHDYKTDTDWLKILQAADLMGTTEVIMPDESGHGLWIARLKQARYWSNSQARLVARRIIWEHIDVLFSQGDFHE